MHVHRQDSIWGIFRLEVFFLYFVHQCVHVQSCLCTFCISVRSLWKPPTGTCNSIPCRQFPAKPLRAAYTIGYCNSLRVTRTKNVLTFLCSRILIVCITCRYGSFFLSGIFQVIDWLPTLLSAAGFDMTKLPKKVDGIDMWQTLNANTSSVSLEHSTT